MRIERMDTCFAAGAGQFLIPAKDVTTSVPRPMGGATEMFTNNGKSESLFLNYFSLDIFI